MDVLVQPYSGEGGTFSGPKTRTSPGSQNPDLTSILWPYTGRLRPKEVRTFFRLQLHQRVGISLSDYTPNLPHLDYRRIPHLVKMFKRNLLKQYQEYCSKNLNKDKFDSSVGNKLSLYSELKNEVRFESYLDSIKNVKTRVAVAKMRISCHLLLVESGLYKKMPRVERLFPLCNRSLGDEFHYLLKCTLSSLSHIRGIFLESLYSTNSNFTNMSYKALLLYIMSMCSENIINLNASYIENILNCHKSEL